MNPFRYIILTVALVAGQAHGQGRLPIDSTDVIEKLRQFETETLARANAEIAAKREAVSKVLEVHLQRETKAGNLDGAVLLKQKIDEFKGGSRVVLPGQRPFEEWVATVRWTLENGFHYEFDGEAVIEFGPEKQFRSQGPVSLDPRSRELKWKWSSGSERAVSFDADLKGGRFQKMGTSGEDQRIVKIAPKAASRP